MKNIKIKLTALLIFAAVTLNTTAQEYKVTENFLHRAEENFINTMDSDINSLVESAIFNMIIFKSKYPEWNYKDIQNKLNKLAVDGNSLQIRYKAQLVSMFISNPEMFQNIEVIDKDNPAKYFRLISDKLQNEIVALK